MTIPIDYHLKTQIICEYNGIPYDLKHQEAIQQIDKKNISQHYSQT